MFKDHLFGLGNVLFNFNENNVEMSVQEASFYGNRNTYLIRARLKCCNEKVKEVKKFSKKQKESILVLPILKQFDMFLRSKGLNIPESMSRPMPKEYRASGGVKLIEVSFYTDDLLFVHGIGGKLVNFRGYGKIDLNNLNIEERMHECKLVMVELLTYNKEKSQLARQIASIEGKETHEVWKENYFPEWSKMLDNAKDKGVSYYKLKDSININEFSVAS